MGVSVVINLSAPGTIGESVPGAAAFTTLMYSASCIATDGSVPNFGRAAVSFAADSDITVAASACRRLVHSVTSAGALTAPRNYVLPLVDGAFFIVVNSTAGGQSIVAKGATGTGVTITNGSTARIYSDGTNYYQA